MTSYNVASINATTFRRADRQVEISRWMEQERVDLCAVQETRLVAGEDTGNRLGRYRIHRCDGGVGTAVLVRKGIGFAPVDLDLEIHALPQRLRPD